ncbi:hypothetical protein [Streptomyces sp. NPDC048637]|uniref:hypothetical protein n=1 Tax=Streptomyces sp. NPDC048637 TaxID=3155636 RepID=UPI003424C3FF
MLVQVEMVPQAARPTMVRVRAPVGTVVLWRGHPLEAEGRHHVEWTVDEDISWGRNTQSAARASPGLWQDGDRIVLRGRLDLTADGAAVLEMGDSQILFDLATPPPEPVDGTWVELRVDADGVALWPVRL